MRARFFFGVSCLALAVSAWAVEAGACAAFVTEHSVQAVDEVAIVLFDAARGEERFIRRARFGVQGAEGEALGFLVPTPSRPHLEAVDQAVFDVLERRLDEHLNPQVVVRREGAGCGRSEYASAAVAAQVTVLEQVRLAGQDATVLRAEDAGALTEWLQQHHFVLQPAVHEYVKRYVARGFFFTAFRYAPGGEARAELATQAVSMRFTTPRAFYPYRESQGRAQPGGRRLRLFVIASTPQRASLDLDAACDAEEADCPAHWRAGKRLWQRELDEDFQSALGSLAPLPTTPHLTVYQDDSNPRVGVADLVFVAAAEGRAVFYVLWSALGLLAALGFVWFAHRLWRGATGRSAAARPVSG